MQSVRTGCRHDGPTALMESDKSGLMNADDKASVLIQTVTMIAVIEVATLS